MAETRTHYNYTPEELLQQSEDEAEQSEREFLKMQLHAVNLQMAGLGKQAEAIRKRLGIEKPKKH